MIRIFLGLDTYTTIGGGMAKFLNKILLLFGVCNPCWCIVTLVLLWVVYCFGFSKML